MPEDNLEQILEAFEQVKGTFHLPQTLSNENDDVTIKYWHSMLRMTEENGIEKESIVNNFCAKFDVDQEQMKDLLSNQHNWVDYNLYHAFAAHCQQQLGMEMESFWENVADITFQDHSDKQIAVARRIPLQFTIKEMNKQFKNWSKVNEIKVEKLERSRNSYVIKKKTLPEAQQRTEQLIGKEALDMLLRRDDHYTHCSFTTTFQKLYNQPNLYLDQGHSEADGNEWSEHYVHPSSPHRFKTVENFYSFLSSLKSFGRNCKTYFLPWLVNKELKQIAFAQEQTISERTQEISRKNATINRKNEELQSRQDLIAKLYSNISKLRFSSDKHAIRNYLNAQFESEKNNIIKQISSQLHLVYALSENNQEGQDYLVNASSSFGIKKEDFSAISSLERKLFQINIDKENDELVVGNNESLDNLDLFEDFFSDEIYLDQAYSEFRSKQEQFKEANKNVLSELDLFQPFYSLRTILEVISYINEKISSVGEIGFDDLLLSDALEIAQKKAEMEKKAEMKLNLELDYNPSFTTDKDTLVNVLAELFYNCVDAQATEVTVYSINPSTKKEEDLPLLNEITGLYPQHYLRIVDNGKGMSEEQVEKLNSYLTTGDIDPSSLSTKGKTTDKGGLGTRNLDNFLLLHKGHCRYKRREDQLGTEVHIYLERTKI
jgi:signal transduction histidine kinase